MQTYREYKESGIQWLGKIPSHWELLRNKNLLFEKKDVVGSNSKAYTLLSLTLRGIIARDMTNPKGKFPKDFDTYKIVQKDNIVFCLFDIEETPRTVGLSSLDGMITGAYDVFEIIEEVNSRYFYFYYLSLDNLKALEPLYTGLRKVINVPKFLSINSPIPPRNEQDKIVNFLDWKISKITKIINAKKKHIQLLKEQKQVIINNAVTKGLDKNAKMKDSGIDWLGDIPEHWEVRKLKNLIKVFNGKEILDPNVIEGDYPVYGSGGVFKYTNSFLYKGKSVLFGRKGTIGKPLLVNGAFWTVDTMYYTECKGNILEEFLYNILCVFPWSKFATKTALPSIVASEVCMQNISLPPLEEQKEIVKHIEEATAKIDELISTLEKKIKFFEEYKISLISNVVTGAMNVQDIVIPEYTIEESSVNYLEEELEEDDEIFEEEE